MNTNYYNFQIPACVGAFPLSVSVRYSLKVSTDTFCQKTIFKTNHKIVKTALRGIDILLLHRDGK